MCRPGAYGLPGHTSRGGVHYHYEAEDRERERERERGERETVAAIFNIAVRQPLIYIYIYREILNIAVRKTLIYRYADI